VTRVIFVVFSEKDEKMYRKGITVQFPPPDNAEESDAVDKDDVQKEKSSEKEEEKK
jgi:hypothetical protein